MPRMIDADKLIDDYNKSNGTISDLMELILDAAEEATLPNDPLTLEELREIADDIADDFISYVTGGVQNAAPYCANMCYECCERPNWCTGYSKACKGFYPKAYRRKPKEGTT